MTTTRSGLVLLAIVSLSALATDVEGLSFELTAVVDKDTPIPGGSGTFACLLTPSISDTRVVFWGSGFEPPFACQPAGIYLFDGTALTTVADTTTAIPGGSGTFTSFELGPQISGGYVVFSGRGSGDQQGIYRFDGFSLRGRGGQEYCHSRRRRDIRVLRTSRAQRWQRGVLRKSRRWRRHLPLRRHRSGEGRRSHHRDTTGGPRRRAGGQRRVCPRAPQGDPHGPDRGALRFEPGDALELRVSVRRTCSGGGHRFGAVRLWYGGAPVDGGKQRDAGSRFDATIDGASRDYFLRSGFALDATPESSRRFVDVAVDTDVPCPNRPFQPFGTWSAVLP